MVAASYPDSLLDFRGHLLQSVAAQGYEVHVCVPNIGESLRRKLNEMKIIAHDVSLSRTSMNPIHDLGYMIRMCRLIFRIKPDVVLTYTIKPNIWGAFASYFAGTKSVSMITGLGYSFTEGTVASIKQRLISKLSRRLYRWATHCNDVVIFQNADDLSDFVAAGCLTNADKARIVNGSGVDLAHYAFSALPSEPVFLMIARLLKNKGVREYGEVVSRLAPRYPNAKFVLVGGFDDGPDRIARSDLDRWVANGLIYEGHQDNVVPFLKAASVYVLPSYREGTPRSVLEAMSMGRPIVTCDVPGCRETVIDGENGFLIPVKDTDALELCMSKLINNSDLRKSMGLRSREIAVEKYDVHKINRELIKCFRLRQ